MSSQPSALSLVTLTIAVLGLVLSAVSLAWQWMAFQLSGSRVTVQMKHGASDGHLVVSGPPGSQNLAMLAQQGFPDEVVGVSARNVGRIAVQVDVVQAVLSDGVKVTMTGGSALMPGLAGPNLPHKLEAQSSESWFLRADVVRQVIAASASVHPRSERPQVRMELELGNGKVVTSKQRIAL